MTFVLHPLSHYNSITEPRAQFLLSLLEHFTIDFPSHFILSIIDMYRDTAIRDKLIFLSAITRILRYFSVLFPSSDHFLVMCAIDYATVKWSEAQAPSTSTPSTSVEGVTLDARLDTLSTEFYQVNTCVDRIARRQASLGGFVESPSPPPKALEASDDDDDGEDGDASFSNSDEMST